MITVHASGGVEMMKAAVEAAAPATVLAVTILTSFSDEDCRAIYGKDRRDAIKYLGEQGSKAGVGGFVCAGEDLPLLAEFGGVRVVPGVRIKKIEGDDQKHITDGNIDADFLVIGRPITQAKDPYTAVEEIKRQLSP